MASDFFEQQDLTKRRTTLLVFLFVLAVVGTIGTFHLLLHLYFSMRYGADYLSSLYWQEHGLTHLMLASAILITILTGRYFKKSLLQQGGHSLALSLGGREIISERVDPQEKKVLNVTQEMALASGIPVPTVYLLENQSSINAFAAGFSPSTAVIAVTAGAISELDRAELQALVAHEFSHILNGDMRLNLHLISWLHGLYAISQVGKHILYRLQSSRRHSRATAAVVLLAVIMIVIGSIGHFFAKLLCRGVSRQREYLADASAVQFTRNPEAVINLFRKIRQNPSKSYFHHPETMDINHMLFAEGLKPWFFNLLSTHPPIWQRAQAIDPRLTPSDLKPLVAPYTPIQDRFESVISQAALDSEGRSSSDVRPDQSPSLQHVQNYLTHLPLSISESITSPLGAQAILYNLLLARNLPHRQKLEKRLQTEFPEVCSYLQKTALDVRQATKKYDIALVELCIPRLRTLSGLQIQKFLGEMKVIVDADRSISLHEFIFSTLIERYTLHQLGPKEQPHKKALGGAKTKKDLRQALITILSTLSEVDNLTKYDREHAYRKAWQCLDVNPNDVELRPAKAPWETLKESLVLLDHLNFRSKKKVIEACQASLKSDGKISTDEMLLLRLICDFWQCPWPYRDLFQHKDMDNQPQRQLIS